MTPIKVLIVEDKSVIAEGLRVLLEKFGMKVISICTSGEDAVEAARTLQPDLVVMDIELEGALDGISTAQLINKDRDLPIIYLTDFSDDKTIQRAKFTHPASYMTKPFNESELVRAIDLAFHNANRPAARKASAGSMTFLRMGPQSYSKVDLDKIVYLKADRAYCVLVTDEGEKTLTTNMNHVFEQIGEVQFMRVHRSYVVNLQRITGIEGNTIMLGDHEAQIGNEYRDAFMQRIKVIR